MASYERSASIGCLAVIATAAGLSGCHVERGALNADSAPNPAGATWHLGPPTCDDLSPGPIAMLAGTSDETGSVANFTPIRGEMGMKGEWLVCAGRGNRGGQFFAVLNFNTGPPGIWCDGWESLIHEVNRWDSAQPILAFWGGPSGEPDTRALSGAELAEFRRRLNP